MVAHRALDGVQWVRNMEVTMPRNGRLLAWIEARNCGRVLAAFVGGIVDGTAKQPAGRAPATQLCASQCEARQWVEGEAAAIGIPVEWVALPDW
jgi:hypothetical protein